MKIWKFGWKMEVTTLTRSEDIHLLIHYKRDDGLPTVFIKLAYMKPNTSCLKHSKTIVSPVLTIVVVLLANAKPEDTMGYRDGPATTNSGKRCLSE